MATISIYDIENERLNELTEKFDTTDAEIIEALFAAIDDWNINIADYL